MNKQPVILCAVDLSRRSLAAFSYALTLAKSRGARLNVVFAVPSRKPFNRRVRQRIALLADLRRQASSGDIDMTVSVQHGNPTDVILAHASSPHSAADLIILGAPGRRGMERLGWASVAQSVVHRTDRPTLVVPGSSFTDEGIGMRFRRVLCATDFSAASMSALDEALRIVRHDGGAMRLLHVVDIVQFPVPRVALEFDAIDHTKELSKHAWRQLNLLLPVSKELHGSVEAQVSVGLVVDEIARSASEFGADIVVVGVKKRGWLARLLNSTTGRALRRVNCPILAVPSSQRNIGASVIRRDLTRLAA